MKKNFYLDETGAFIKIKKTFILMKNYFHQDEIRLAFRAPLTARNARFLSSQSVTKVKTSSPKYFCDNADIVPFSLSCCTALS